MSLLYGLLLSTAITASLSASGLADTRYDGDRVVRVHVNSLRQWRAVEQLSEDLWSHAIRGGVAEVRVASEKWGAFERALRELGVRHEVLIPDVQALIDAERVRLAGADDQGGLAGADWFADFKDNAAINAYLDELTALRPDLVQSITLGQSLEGRPIRGLRIAAGPGKPAAFYNGCQHAREWISPMVVMYLADTLVRQADAPEIDSLLDRLEFIIVPVVNPDGYQFTWDDNRLWRKNRRDNGNGTIGVDLNRNWSYEWGGDGASSNPGSDTYRGPFAFSEPETQAMRDFFLANPQIAAAIDFHSFSQYVLYPWGYTSAPTDDDALFELIGEGMADSVVAVHGVNYVAGQVNTLLYPASGVSIDWMYGERGALAYTIELRDTGEFGFVLPPEQIIPTAEENLGAALLLADLATRPALLRYASQPAETVEAGESTTLLVEVIPTIEAISTVTLWSRIGLAGAFTAAPATSLGGNLWSAELPAAPCGAILQWYVEATTVGGFFATLPEDAPTALDSATAVTTATVFVDAAETNLGWSLITLGDNATAGLWTRVDPNGTSAQSEDDHTPSGSFCFVTGQGTPGGQPGQADVDAGATTLTSPTLDASLSGATLSWWYWYSNNFGANPGTDPFRVEFSSDGGATWALAEETFDATNAWVQRSIVVADVVAPSNQFRVRFIASDFGTGSLVEAAIDDVALDVVTCAEGTLGDIDRDGDVDGADFGLMLALWGTANGGAIDADLNDDGLVDGADVGLLLAGWSG